MLPEAILVIDGAAVILRDLTPPELIVGEIKTYPDRGGYTEPAQLAQARAQAGVYVHGLDLGVQGAEDRRPRACSAQGIPRAQPARFQRAVGPRG